MQQINVKIDDNLLAEFRGVIYQRRGLKKGDLKDSIEEAMLEYVIKYTKSDAGKEFAKRAKDELKA